jgi:hypothetical protein
MLVLPPLDPSPIPGRVCFADHAVADRCYVLPAAVTVAVEPDGSPDFVLLRYRDRSGEVAGGLLRTSLTWVGVGEAEAAAAPGRDLRSVSFERCRYRMTRRVVAGSGPAVGPWQPAVVGGRDVAVITIALSPEDEQLVQDLITNGTDVLAVEVEGVYSARVEGRPWLVTADRAHLVAVLRALLGDQPATAAQISAAFASLPQQPPPFTLTALQPGAASLDPAWVTAELGARALPLLFSPVSGTMSLNDGAAVDGPADDGSSPEPTYRLTDGATGIVSIDLLVPRVESATASFAWSISSLSDSLIDPQRRAAAFPAVGALDPFEIVTITVLCNVPFDHRWLQSVQIDLQYSSAQGVPAASAVSFPGDAPVARLPAVVPPGDSGLGLRWRPRATLATFSPSGAPGWPMVLVGQERSQSSPIVVIDGRALGIDFVRIVVDASVFTLAGSVNVDIQGQSTGVALARATLDATAPSAWVALPGAGPEDALVATVTAVPAGAIAPPAPPPASVPVTAATPTPAAEAVPAVQAAVAPVLPPLPPGAVLVRSGPIVDRRVLVAESDVASPPPDEVSVSLSSGAADHFAFVAISLVASAPGAEVETRALNPGDRITVPIARASVFAPLRYRYQLMLVAFDSTHATLPLVTTDWVEAEGSPLDLDPTPVLTP